MHTNTVCAPSYRALRAYQIKMTGPQRCEAGANINSTCRYRKSSLSSTYNELNGHTMPSQTINKYPEPYKGYTERKLIEVDNGIASASDNNSK